MPLCERHTHRERESQWAKVGELVSAHARVTSGLVTICAGELVYHLMCPIGFCNERQGTTVIVTLFSTIAVSPNYDLVAPFPSRQR